MRVALIADIHGNCVALETVLTHISGQSVDQVVCLGDVAALGPEPAACLDLVRDHAAISIMGNTDAWLLRTEPGQIPTVSDVPILNVITEWTSRQITDAHLRQIEVFPSRSRIDLSRATAMLAFHGSPRSHDDVIAATTPERELDEMLAGTEAAIHAGGHTHLAMLRRIPRGVVTNPGSVGLPGVGPGDPGLTVNTDVYWAEYAMVESSLQATSFEFYRLPVSVREMIHCARQSGMPGFDWWVSKWRTKV